MKRLLYSLGALALMGCAQKTQPKRPDVVLVVVDDLGYSDLGCYGSSIQTPNIDALAQNGVRFSQFYNGARCCPSRASLLTGVYAHQAGVGHMTEDRGVPAYAGDLSKNAVTIAEVLLRRASREMGTYFGVPDLLKHLEVSR